MLLLCYYTAYHQRDSMILFFSERRVCANLLQLLITAFVNISHNT